MIRSAFHSCILLHKEMFLHDSPTQRRVRVLKLIVAIGLWSLRIFPTEKSAVLADCIDLCGPLARYNPMLLLDSPILDHKRTKHQEDSHDDQPG